MAGKSIKDHKFFGGSGSPKFPTGNKLKSESSAEGHGGVSDYQDTTEKIKATQEHNKSKLKGHAQKESHRN